jgi:hypothetical protein
MLGSPALPVSLDIAAHDNSAASDNIAQTAVDFQFFKEMKEAKDEEAKEEEDVEHTPANPEAPADQL